MSGRAMDFVRPFLPQADALEAETNQVLCVDHKLHHGYNSQNVGSTKSSRISELNFILQLP